MTIMAPVFAFAHDMVKIVLAMDGYFWFDLSRENYNVKYGFIGELVEQMEFKCSKKKLYLKPNQILWF